MAIAFVQGAASGGFTSSPTTIAMPGNSTAGNTMLVFLTHNYLPCAPNSVTDTLGNTYTRDATFTSGVSGNLPGFLFSAPITSTGANTVSISFGCGTSQMAFAVEYSGIAASPFDGQANLNNTSTSGSCGGLTTTATGDLIVGCFVGGIGYSYTSTGGATTRSTDPLNRIWQDQLAGVAGSYDSTVTSSGGSGSYPYNGYMFAYKASGGAPPAAQNSGFLQFM